MLQPPCASDSGVKLGLETYICMKLHAVVRSCLSYYFIAYTRCLAKVSCMMDAVYDTNGRCAAARLFYKDCMRTLLWYSTASVSPSSLRIASLLCQEIRQLQVVLPIETSWTIDPTSLGSWVRFAVSHWPLAVIASDLDCFCDVRS